MASHMVDSEFFRSLFGTKEMREVFTDTNLIQCWLDVEAALARAEGRLGLIPVAAATEISKKARAELLDFQEIERQIAHTVHPMMPVIRALEEACDGEAGQYVHWGPTTQDVMDTATILQLRQASELIRPAMRRIETSMKLLAEKHRDTAMVGRTHGQHAVPITFGFKVAVWLAEWMRHQERFEECLKRLLVGQLSGAAGTLATLPELGLEVQKETLRELDLAVPTIAWHTSRDALTEWCLLLGMVGGTCGKIGNEIIQLQKTEVDELAEPHNDGKVGSSTMPHKRNPMLCEAIVSLSQLIRGNSSTALSGVIHEHERDMGPWQAEWEFLPEICILTAGCLELTARVLEGLEVRRESMHRNLNLTKGMICSEAVMIDLGKDIGRQRAHDVVYSAAMRAHDAGITLMEALLLSDEVRRVRTPAQLEALLDPSTYLGYSAIFVDQVLRGSLEPVG